MILCLDNMREKNVKKEAEVVKLDDKQYDITT